MRKKYTISLIHIQIIMAIFNFINILFCLSIVLLTTKHITNNRLARDFLANVTSIPKEPLHVFFISIILYILLLIIMYVRHKEKLSEHNFMYGLVEIIICFLIIYNLYIGYNGIILLFFTDIIIHTKENKNTFMSLGILVFLFLLTNYDVISIQIPMVSLQDFMNVYDSTTRVALVAAKNILESLNLVIFIIFMIAYIANQKQENENIMKELSMINQVNEELRNYATITEKAAENRERKRLAREIHDTLGHALTGIAAGVDACIALIDKDAKQTKEQLYLVSKVVREGIGDVRGSINKLRPGALENHSFKEAVIDMVGKFSKITDVDVDIHYDLDKVDFDKTKEDTLFRIIQEGITNAKRHGEATKVKVYLSKEDNHLFLCIQDNGKGCQDIQAGFGLKHMEERVSMMQGEIHLSGHNGFRISIKIPMQEGESYD